MPGAVRILLLALSLRPFERSAMRFLLFLLTAAGLLAGCASHHSKPKSVTHVYGGDSPAIHMQETQGAGGELHTY